MALGACGGDAPGDNSLSSEADQGRKVIQSNGCSACHGSTGGGGIGPPFVGLYGSEVALDDGTTVIADEDYLRRSIRDPGADIVAGFPKSMPTVNLSDEQVDQIIAYIRELATEASP